MADTLLLFGIGLALLAAVLRADFVLTLLYLLLGVFVVGRWWSRRASSAIQVLRIYERRAFLGEKVPVRLNLSNQGLLPVVWLQLEESLPTGLSLSGLFRRVVSLGPRDHVQFEYLLEGRRRGYYPIGPLIARSGDLFGVAGEQSLTLPPDSLTVFPKIIPLTKVRLPSRSPLGSLRHHLPIYEDPTRVMGKRDYTAGDSLRRVDWKSSAASGRMQVKVYEPSIALETAIFLNLNTSEYEARARWDASELAIVVAASLASYLTGLRQPVGLVTNGADPLESREEDSLPLPIAPRRGRGHLMRILDLLARVGLGEAVPFETLLRREMVHLAWGTTVIVITPQIDDGLFEALFAARRAGLTPMLVPCGPVAGAQELRRRAEHFGVPFEHILYERDLDRWRR
jgi:uncharacterized protein (DUF58 family)